MPFRKFVILAVFAYAISPSARCQDVRIVNGPPETTEHALQRHGVALNQEALLAALRSPDGEVRYLAAFKLASDKASEAIPAITDAMAAEQVPGTRINIAFSLALLGDEGGFAELESACRSADVAGFLRARAMQYLLWQHRGSTCAHAVLDMLQREPDEPFLSLVPALDLVAKVKELVPEEEFQMMFELVLNALTKPKMPAERIEAAVALANIGNAAAIPYLQKAIANESEEGVRHMLQIELEALQKKLDAPPPEKVLFEQATAAWKAKRYAVANLKFQTLLNTYPDSEHAPEAKLALEDPQIAGCGQPWNPPECDDWSAKETAH